MRLYLIRHGKTTANEQHLYCGATDLDLSENGLKQLQNITYEIPRGCHFMTSGMRRTNQTLKVLFGDVSYQEDSRFREMHFGIFEMGSYHTLINEPEYRKWISGDNESNICPMGESGKQMKVRVLEGLRELLSCGQDTVLIAHGGTIALIMEELFPEEGKNRYEWQPKPGCGYLVEDSSYKPIPQQAQ